MPGRLCPAIHLGGTMFKSDSSPAASRGMQRPAAAGAQRHGVVHKPLRRAVFATVASLMATAAAAHGRVFHFEINHQSLSEALQTYAQICGKDVIFTQSVVAGSHATSLVGDFTAQDALSRLLAGTQLVVKRSPSGALMILKRGANIASVSSDPPAGAGTVAANDPPADPPAAAATSQTVPQPAAAAAAAPQGNLGEVIVTGSLIASRSYTSSSPLVTVGAGQITSAGQVSLDTALGQMPQFAAGQGQTEVGDVQGATGFQGGQSYADLRGLGAERTLVLLDGQRLVPTSPAGSVDLNVIPMALIKSVDVITGGASAVYGSDAIAGVVNFRLRQHFSGIQLSYQHGASTHGYGKEDSFSVLMGGNFAHHKGNAVVDMEYNERGGVTGSQLAFFNSPQFARTVPFPPEGRFQLGGVPIAAVNGVLAQYPGTTPLSGTGTYPGFFGVNNDGSIFTTGDAPNCVQNYRPTGHTLGLAISPNCQQIVAQLGPYFAAQVPSRRYNLFAHVTYNVNDNLQAYGQINFMHSTAQDLQGGAFFNGNPKPLLVPLNNPFVQNNASLQTLINAQTTPSTGPLVVEQWATMLGPRIEQFDYNDYQFTAGLKGGIGSTSLVWNVFGSYGETNFNNYEQNTINLPALETIMYGTANYQGGGGNNCIGYAWNPLGNNPMSKGCLEYVNGTAKNINVLSQKYFEGDLSGNLWRLPEGNLKFAVGADYRGDSFNYQASPLLNPAVNTLQAFAPNLPQQIISPSYDLAGSTGGTQNVREVYIELRAPLLRNKPFAKNVTVDVAGRHSQYNLFGGANTWKADLHWEVNDTVTFRGGFQRAFRAPSLQDLYNPSIQAQVPISGDPCDYNSSFRTGPNAAQVAALCQAQGVPANLLSSYSYGEASANGLYAGNTHLKPEVADTYTVGFVLTPHFNGALDRDIGASVDYYHIKINGAVGAVTGDLVLQSCFNANGDNPTYSANNYFCQQITRDHTSGAIATLTTFEENIGSYTTDGVDIEAHWGFPLRALGLSPSAGRVLLQTYVSFLRSLQVVGLGAPSVNLAGSVADTYSAIAADGASISDLSHPKWKANTMLGYANGPVGVALHWRFISSMQDLMDGLNSGDAGIPAYSYFDLNGHYQVNSHIDVTAGITNLFDKKEPFIAGAPLLTDAATYDILGREYYVGVKANID